MNSLQESSTLLLPSTFLNKKGLEAWAAQKIEEKLETESTIDLLEEITRMETVVEVMKTRVRAVAKVEYNGCPGNYKGLNLAFKGGRKSLDYSRDQIWNRIKNQLDDREEFLKSLKEPTSILNEDTGEVLKAYPPLVTYGADSITVTLR